MDKPCYLCAKPSQGGLMDFLEEDRRTIAVTIAICPACEALDEQELRARVVVGLKQGFWREDHEGNHN